MKEKLQRLRAEIASDRRAFEEKLREIEQLRLEGEHPEGGQLAWAAVALHHAYGAVESLLSRVTRTLEGSLPEGPDWHQALLDGAGLEIEGVRPRLLSPDVIVGLRRLLAFRHFFRHAYSVALDPVRLRDLRREAMCLREPLQADLDGLDSFLRDLAEAGA